MLEKELRFAMEGFKKEHGADAKLEDGDDFVTVFNNGILILSVEEQELKIKVLLGEPYRVNEDIELGVSG